MTRLHGATALVTGSATGTGPAVTRRSGVQVFGDDAPRPTSIFTSGCAAGNELTVAAAASDPGIRL